MNRRELVKLGAAQAAFVAVSGGSVERATAKTANFDDEKTVVLRSAQLELSVNPKEKLWCRLLHRPTGKVLADGIYSYSFGSPVLSNVRSEGDSLLIEGTIPETGMAFRHR